MPVVLILAFAASLGIHAAALFGPDIELTNEPEVTPLVADLRPMPKALVEPVKDESRAVVRPVKKKGAPVRSGAPAVTAPAVMPMPEAAVSMPHETLEEADGGAMIPDEPLPTLETPVAPVISPRLPERGQIRYRVDRGDANFEIGRASSDWEIVDGTYVLRLHTETTGLVWLFKPYQVDMESRGRLTPEGLQPERFSILRNGVETREKAEFDWKQMQVRVGNGAPQPVSPGAQDLLSFNFHLGFMPESRVARTLPIATGKKYGIYRLEVVGDETISLPAGEMRTLHLRAPGVNTTELWLAYDYLLLPVKIRHEDGKGNSLVQMATEIRLGISEPTVKE